MPSKGQQPGESDRQYMSRMREEATRQRREKYLQQQQEKYQNKAALEKALRESGQDPDDAELFSFVENELGASIGDIRKAYSQGKLDDVPAIQDALEAVEKAGKVGFFDSKAAANRRQRKMIKKHQKTLRKAAKKSKRKGWFW